MLQDKWLSSFMAHCSSPDFLPTVFHIKKLHLQWKMQKANAHSNFAASSIKQSNLIALRNYSTDAPKLRSSSRPYMYKCTLHKHPSYIVYHIPVSKWTVYVFTQFPHQNTDFVRLLQNLEEVQLFRKLVAIYILFSSNCFTIRKSNKILITIFYY